MRLGAYPCIPMQKESKRFPKPQVGSSNLPRVTTYSSRDNPWPFSTARDLLRYAISILIPLHSTEKNRRLVRRNEYGVKESHGSLPQALPSVRLTCIRGSCHQ